MRIGAIKDLDKEHGEGGFRMTFFLTGCAFDNCTSKYKDYNYGVERDVQELVEYISDRSQWIKGFSLTGGDPLFQLIELTQLLELIRKDPKIKDIDIWMKTHHPFEAVPDKIKRLVDTIVDDTDQSYDKIQSKYYEKR